LDPEELYEADSDVPHLEGAVLLLHLNGFVDAGSAGEVLTRYLLDNFEHSVVARFDADRLIDYRSRRPLMTYVTDHWEEYRKPELQVLAFHDQVGTPFLLVTGPEPDHEWELFASALRSLIERWNIRLTVSLHGIPMDIPHTRPLSVTAHATRSELVEAYPPFFSQVQVPASASAVVELRLGQAGHDALGFAVHVPHYLAHASYPAAAVTLLENVTMATGLSLPDDSLREAARRTDREIAAQVSESVEIADVVRALESRYDTFIEANEQRSLLADTTALPTADELGSQFERFLAEQEPTES
jgi:predicted ATP-grasp superfamily ATP-dependent carboligase